MKDYMNTERITLKGLVSATATRIDLKPPFGKVAAVRQVNYFIHPDNAGGDQYICMGVSKYHVDNIPTPTGVGDVLDEGEVFCKVVHGMTLDTAVGFSQAWLDREFDLWDNPLYFVLDPTLIAFISGRAVTVDIYYNFVAVDQITFNRVAAWQGGY